MSIRHGKLSTAALLLVPAGLISALAMTLLMLNPGTTLIFGPLAVVFTLVALLLGIGTIWASASAFHAFLVAAAIVFIDLGINAGGAIPLAIKGVAYAASSIVGIRYLVGAERHGFTLGAAFLGYAIFAWSTVLLSTNPGAIAHTGFALVALALATISIERMEFNGAAKITGWVAVLIGIGTLVSILLYLFFPWLAIATNVAGTGRSGGIFGSPNSFGAVAVVGVMTGVAAIRSPLLRVGPRSVLLFLTLTSFGGLLISGSRTALGALMFSAGIVALSLRMRLVVMLTFVATTIAFGLWLTGGLEGLLLLLENALSRSPRSGDVRTLTGRLDIWHFAYTQWLSEPWLGFGLGESRKVISEGWANRWGGSTGSAHNLLFESLLNVGLIGTVMLFAIVLVAAVRLFRLDPAENARSLAVRPLAIGLLAFPLIQGVTEKSFGGTASISTGALLIAIGYVTALARK